jgi:hypothetical protein
MGRISVCTCVLLLLVFGVVPTVAQEQATAATASAVPKVVNYSGALADLNNKPLTGVVGVTFYLYKEAQGGAPLWMETQNVQLGKDGHYGVTLGSTTSHGLPADVFVSGEARWLGVQVQGQNEQPRVLLVAVPYALKSGDAETLGGLPASAFLLAAPPTRAPSPTAATGADGSSAVPPPPATITGSGTAGFLPDFTGAATIGNSAVFQSGASPTAKIGINTNAPTNTLDVHGGAAIRGTFVLPATGTATAAGGKISQPENLAASAFNSGTATPVTQTFQLKAEPVNNNTPSASASLNVLFGQGVSAPAETGLKIGSNGRITFAAGQAFPGTGPGTVTSVGSGLGLTGGPITGSGTLAIDTSVVPQRGVNNFWPADQSFLGSIGVSNNATVSGGLGVGGSMSAGGNITSSTLTVGSGETFGNSIQYTDNAVASQVQPSLLINAVDCCVYGDRMIWAHSPSFPFWGIYYDDDADVMRWQQNFGVNAMLLDFSGNLTVTGAITAGVKDFKIDHPLDPTNKYLYHSSVESSEMMNIYTGNAVLDSAGQARVSLPNWFEAVNADFRYQLTAIGAAAPGLHIAKEIANHEFSIAGGAPGMKVSWQVTGVRHDAYAKAHPLEVEVAKPADERGHYLHPEAFGQPRLTQDEMFRQRKLQEKSKGQSEHALRSVLLPAKQ